MLAIIGLLCTQKAISQDGLQRTFTLSAKKTPLSQVMREIEKQTGVNFSYSNNTINVEQPLSFVANAKKISAFLEEELKPLHIGYEFVDQKIVLYSLKPGQPSKTVKARVINEKGDPVQGVTVTEKDKSNIVMADNNGYFNITVSGSDDAALLFSSVGYESVTMPVSQIDATTIVILKEKPSALQEVVVTALGIKREEKSLGYAVQKLNGDDISRVKPLDIGTALTGKISGMTVLNSTEFNTAPTIYLRGETPLLVVDGVPYGNMSLRDIAPDDIESMSVLKGPTASALYGSRGGNGAIMVTLKNKQKEGGLNVSFNSSTMFEAGFLAMPKVQTSYSSGSGGKYAAGDYVWGDKMDIGRNALQYNPKTYQWETMPLVSKGVNNLDNFLQQGFITTNNISVSQQGKNGSFRTSLTSVYNKGQYPNTKLNKITATMAGEMRAGNFSLEGGLSYNKRFYPNNIGTGYGGGGYMYNLVIWSGVDYDIRDFKNYWLPGKENVQQSWSDNTWYDNPYFIANEILHANDYSLTNGYINASYSIKPWLKATLRTGMDAYASTDTWRNAMSAVGGWNKKGYYGNQTATGFSTNNDLILSANTRINKWRVDGLIGGSIYYYQDNSMMVETQNGISVPGYYSIAASVDPAKVTPSTGKKQVNSAYAKASVSWNNLWFLDVTGRNDWSSTLSARNRSYFYPSAASSFVFSELVKMPDWVSSGKVRGSWTQTKSDPAVYAIQNAYTATSNVWNGLNSAAYPTALKNSALEPQTSRTYEMGAAFAFLKNKLNFDIAYFNKLYYNQIANTTISNASGFATSQVNTQQQIVRRGVEVTISGTPINKKNFRWDATFNWSFNHQYYQQLDAVYSSKYQWVQQGARYDWISVYNWDRSPDGQMINQGGYPVKATYLSVMGNSDPNWIWGLNNNIHYKQFNLSFSLDGRVGGLAYSNTNQAMWNSGVHPESDNKFRYEEVVNGNRTFVAPGVIVTSGTVDRDVNGNITKDTRVFAPNTQVVSYEAYIKRYQSNAYTAQPQNYFQQTFFKLREVSLTYDLPSAVCKRLSMKNASLGLVGQNVLLWTKEFKYADPDRGADNLNSPSIRYIGFTLKANF